jgi:hypothetical protein
MKRWNLHEPNQPSKGTHTSRSQNGKRSVINDSTNKVVMKKERIAQQVSARIPSVGALRIYLAMMQSSIMSSAIVCAFAAAVFMSNANAQPSVSWQTPVTISGTADVSTLGIYFGSWAPQDANANTLPVNGVTFQGFPTCPA